MDSYQKKKHLSSSQDFPRSTTFKWKNECSGKHNDILQFVTAPTAQLLHDGTRNATVTVGICPLNFLIYLNGGGLSRVTNTITFGYQIFTFLTVTNLFRHLSQRTRFSHTIGDHITFSKPIPDLGYDGVVTSTSLTTSPLPTPPQAPVLPWAPSRGCMVVGNHVPSAVCPAG